MSASEAPLVSSVAAHDLDRLFGRDAVPEQELEQPKRRLLLEHMYVLAVRSNDAAI